MRHEWELKVGVELHGGSSLPTRIRCKQCGLGFWAYQIRDISGRLGDDCPGEAQKLAEQECPGRKS